MARFVATLPRASRLLGAVVFAIIAVAGPGNLPTRAEAEARAVPIERVTFLHDQRQQEVEGRIVVESADGGLLVEAEDGMMWIVEGDEVLRRERLERPFAPLTNTELGERLLAELPAGFRLHTTARYVVCYDTSRAYAQWTGSLLERLYKALTNYWENQGLELREPEFPLVVVIFAERRMYEVASRDDLPDGAGGIIGYYSLRSNRVNMFDLTGAEAVRGAEHRRGSLREINQMLSQPAALPLVATIVHEATHQIAFNCGLSARYADIPLWLCEGMAVYFEAPDLASTRGWRGIGRVNHSRLERFRANLPNWHAGSLERLLADDRRFRDADTALDAYADAWALNYYLIKHQPAAYLEYLKMLAGKRPLVPDEPHTRLEEFRQHFGDLRSLEREFLRQMSRVK